MVPCRQIGLPISLSRGCHLIIDDVRFLCTIGFSGASESAQEPVGSAVFLHCTMSQCTFQLVVGVQPDLYDGL